MILGLGGKGQDGVGCYGKLPLHGDYVSHQCDGAEARRLTAWLDEGYRLTGGTDDIENPATCFVLPGRKKGSLYGRIWPSADSSGTRRFPFALFAEASVRVLTELGPTLTFGLMDGTAAMENAMASLKECAAPEGIGHIVSEIPVATLPEPRNALVSLHHLTGQQALTPTVSGALFDLARLTAALPDGAKGKPPPFAIRLPLATDMDPQAEASVWLSVLGTRLRAPKLAGDTAIFARARHGDVPGDLVLIHRELKPEDLAFVLSPTEDYAYGNYLGEEVDEDALSPFRSWLAERVGSAPTMAEVAGLDLSEYST